MSHGDCFDNKHFDLIVTLPPSAATTVTFQVTGERARFLVAPLDDRSLAPFECVFDEPIVDGSAAAPVRFRTIIRRVASSSQAPPAVASSSAVSGAAADGSRLLGGGTQTVTVQLTITYNTRHGDCDTCDVTLASAATAMTTPAAAIPSPWCVAASFPVNDALRDMRQRGCCVCFANCSVDDGGGDGDGSSSDWGVVHAAPTWQVVSVESTAAATSAAPAAAAGAARGDDAASMDKHAGPLPIDEASSSASTFALRFAGGIDTTLFDFGSLPPSYPVAHRQAGAMPPSSSSCRAAPATCGAPAAAYTAAHFAGIPATFPTWAVHHHATVDPAVASSGPAPAPVASAVPADPRGPYQAAIRQQLQQRRAHLARIALQQHELGVAAAAARDELRRLRHLLRVSRAEARAEYRASRVASSWGESAHVVHGAGGGDNNNSNRGAYPPMPRRGNNDDGSGGDVSGSSSSSSSSGGDSDDDAEVLTGTVVYPHHHHPHHQAGVAPPAAAAAVMTSSKEMKKAVKAAKKMVKEQQRQAESDARAIAKAAKKAEKREKKGKE